MQQLQFRDVGPDAFNRNFPTLQTMVTCISDRYAADDDCRMQLQFAKKTLRLPAIPCVVADSWAWQHSVVGLLIAGELYVDMNGVKGASSPKVSFHFLTDR